MSDYSDDFDSSSDADGECSFWMLFAGARYPFSMARSLACRLRPFSPADSRHRAPPRGSGHKLAPKSHGASSKSHPSHRQSSQHQQGRALPRSKPAASGRMEPMLASSSAASRGGEQPVSASLIATTQQAAHAEVTDVTNRVRELLRDREILREEIRTLRRLGQRQERALEHYEGQSGELPQLLRTHAEELRVLRHANQQLKDRAADAEGRLRRKQEHVDELEGKMRKMQTLLKERNLEERDALARRVDELSKTLSERDARVADLEKRVMLNDKIKNQHELDFASKSSRAAQEVRELQQKVTQLEDKLREAQHDAEIERANRRANSRASFTAAPLPPAASSQPAPAPAPVTLRTSAASSSTGSAPPMRAAAPQAHVQQSSPLPEPHPHQLPVVPASPVTADPPPRVTRAASPPPPLQPPLPQAAPLQSAAVGSSTFVASRPPKSPAAPAPELLPVAAPVAVTVQPRENVAHAPPPPPREEEPSPAVAATDPESSFARQRSNTSSTSLRMPRADPSNKAAEAAPVAVQDTRAAAGLSTSVAEAQAAVDEEAERKKRELLSKLRAIEKGISVPVEPVAVLASGSGTRASTDATVVKKVASATNVAGEPERSSSASPAPYVPTFNKRTVKPLEGERGRAAENLHRGLPATGSIGATSSSNLATAVDDEEAAVGGVKKPTSGGGLPWETKKPAAAAGTHDAGTSKPSWLGGGASASGFKGPMASHRADDDVDELTL
jgi:hypothetical protein